MVTVEFDFMGEAVRLALVAGEYLGGGLAVLLLDATDPRSDGYMAEWGVLTANVPAAAEWCRGHGNIAIDATTPAALLGALEAAGMLRMAGRSAASGMARYPLATVAGHVLDGMGGLPETLEEALGSTVVVEYESGGDGGAFELGTAPSGSVSVMPRPSTARRAERSTRPERNSHGRHPHGHAGDGAPLAAFTGDASRRPRTPARQRDKSPWNPGRPPNEP